MSKKKKAIEKIIPGSSEWESICEQCGLCCLVKYRDEDGLVHLTSLACDNYETLNNDYVVPAFCPYVQKLADAKDKVKRLQRPDFAGIKFIPESERTQPLNYYIIKDTWKYFMYNYHLNKRYAQEAKSKKR